MALRRFDLDAGGTSFVFRPETEDTIAFWLAKYPADRQRSAVIPLLWLAQKDNGGWLSEPAMRLVADRLEMPYMRVYEVATFYTMFRLQPVARNHVQLCGTTPCQLRGAEALKEVCQREIGKPMFVTDDQRLSWEEVECLGACVNGPMVQINDDYFEDLTPDSLLHILTRLRNGADVQLGPQIDRINSAPAGGLTSLTEAALFDGSRNGIGALPNVVPAAPPAPAPGVDNPAAPIEAALPDRKAPTNTSRETSSQAETKTTLIDSTARPRAIAPAEEARPARLAAPPANPDDLKQINGVGPKYEQDLHALGVYTFAQIAAWSQETVDWVEAHLGFRDRIDREEWVVQCKMLAAGKFDAHARDYGRGKD